MIEKQNIDILTFSHTDAKKISIIIHKNPDGDALGSSFGLAYYLENMKTDLEVFIISPTDIPEYFNWILSYRNILIHTKDPSETTNAIMHSQIIYMLDFNDYKRMDNLAEIVESTNAFKILIDHHPSPKIIADIDFSFPQISSTAEIIWNIMKEWNLKYIDKKVAEFIYLGILSDTGCFCYNSTDENTHKAAAEILSYKINKELIINRLYRNYSEERTRFLGYLLYKKMKIYNNKTIALIPISNEDKKRFNYKKGDHEEIVNIPLTISQVHISFLFLEDEENKVRISIRSIGDYPVNNIAAKYFDGGGHKNASGGTFYGNITEAIKYFEYKVLPILQVNENKI